MSISRVNYSDTFRKLTDTVNALVDTVEDANERLNNYSDKIGILNKKTDGIVSVKEFGAKGDGVTDDKQQIIDAINKCIALKGANRVPILYFPYSSGYATTGTIAVPAGISVIMDAPLIYTGISDEPCLVIGEATSVNPNVKLRLQVERATLSNWTNENNVGIRLINLSESEVEIVKAKKFTIGVQCQGNNSKGFVYNEIKLFSILENKIGLDLTSKNAGWCNENNFYGGRFGVSTGMNNGLSRYGVRITSENGYLQNNNHFIKPSFELKQVNAYPGEALSVLIERGTQNTFRTCRDETGSTVFARILNNSSENYIHLGYGSGVIDDKSDYPFNRLERNRHGIRDQLPKLLFQVSNIHKRACYYDGGTNIHIAGLHLAWFSNATVYKSSNDLTITDDYLEIRGTRGVGVFVDTRKVKRFIVNREVITGYAGRVTVRCYDSNGKILTDQDPNHPYVKGTIYHTPFYATYYGGTYRSGVDNDNSYYFVIHDDVKKIEVILHGGTNPCRLRGFSIYTLDDNHASVYPGYDEIVPGANLAITAPTAGKHYKGRIIYNDNPSQGSCVGWICTTAGVANNRSWTASTAYSVGQQVNANGQVYECTTAGTSGSTAPSGTGSSITDGTVTWKYVDVLATFEEFGIVGFEDYTILKSPDGSKWKVTVDNTGALTTTKLR